MKQRHEPLLETTKGWIFDRKARENYCWEIIQDMIDKEVSSAFKLKEQIESVAFQGGAVDN